MLLDVVARKGGGGKVALAREGVYVLLTAMTPGSHSAYAPRTVKRPLKTALLNTEGEGLGADDQSAEPGALRGALPRRPRKPQRFREALASPQ